MEIVVKGRRTEVSQRFRRHVIEKLAKVERLAPRVMRVDVELSSERNPRRAEQSQRVELTCRSKGPVIRAEAAADDLYAALDLAFARLEQRLRRAADRRRVHHGSRTPVSVAAATSTLASATSAGQGAAGPAAEAAAPPLGAADEHLAPLVGVNGEGPMVIREKVHAAVPMSLEQALYEMELVGHDFFLYVDARSAAPSVVYRRRGYDYGVIRLEVAERVED
ncbi:MAG TPA: ribosome-associated translation inhibitor RaiA [Actinomycetes bacterium]|nr:ribosome-associated translation inhibitor RaiA [Actinomycetes bacterium]